MKRVLIITYYWPPNGGAGVQRWLKFVKYLPEHGWKPLVYTPANPEVMVLDEDLSREVPVEAEILTQPIREPYSIYKRFTGRANKERLHTGFLNESKKVGWRESAALWVRSNFFIPDARAGWVKPSIKFLTKYLRENSVDAILTTGPPHSMHLIGLGLKRALNVKWIADFRDPWTNIDFYHQLSLTKGADRKHRRLQAQVLNNADKVIAIGKTLGRELEELGAKNVAVIMNGHDINRTDDTPAPQVRPFDLVHVGSLTATRNAPELWKALKQLCDLSSEFEQKLRIRLVGPVDHSIKRSIARAGLDQKIDHVAQMPHADALHEMKQAGVLLLLLNDTANAKGILTSKLFEYLATGRPILAIGPKDGDVSDILGPDHLLLERGTEKENAQHILELFGQTAPLAHCAAIHSRVERCKELVRTVLDPLTN